MHDPTTLNKREILEHSIVLHILFIRKAKQTAESVIAKVNASQKWPIPIVTEVTKAGAQTRYHKIT